MSSKHAASPAENDTDKPTRAGLRLFSSFICAISFGISLRLSNLSEANRVIRFLATPLSPTFDPSLAFLALGAIPLGALLFHFARGDGQPRLGGKTTIPEGNPVTARLLVGAAIFGVGWGMSGICRKDPSLHRLRRRQPDRFIAGPSFVNLGESLVVGKGILLNLGWILFMGLGGLLA